MQQQEFPPPADAQTLPDPQLDDLAHRSTWHWRQALWWLVLGVAILNLPWFAGVAAGLGVHVLIGFGVNSLWGLERPHALRWRERLRVVKWCLTAVYPAATLVTVVHWARTAVHPAARSGAAIHRPNDPSAWAALPNIFRISAHFDRSPYSTGWVGEGWVLAALILAALLHIVINELVFPADLAFGRRFFSKRVRTPFPSMFRRGPLKRIGMYWFSLMIVVFIFWVLLTIVRSGGGPRGRMFDANANVFWPLPWWWALSAINIFARIPRICSAQMALEPSRRHET